MSWVVEEPIAHRGLHGPDVAENSLTACQAAIDAGYPIEIDVRRTRDGVPVVFHDKTLSRMTGIEGRVADFRWRELADLQLGDTTDRIPRLAEVLECVDDAVPLLIELKNDGMGHALETAVGAVLEEYDGRFALQSFNPISLAYFRRRYPSWSRGQLAGSLGGATSIPRSQRLLVERLLCTWLSRPGFIAYEHAQLPYWPVTLHRYLGLPVVAWTIRSEDALQQAQQHADNVIFEDIRP